MHAGEVGASSRRVSNCLFRWEVSVARGEPAGRPRQGARCRAPAGAASALTRPPRRFCVLFKPSAQSADGARPPGRWCQPWRCAVARLGDAGGTAGRTELAGRPGQGARCRAAA